MIIKAGKKAGIIQLYTRYKALKPYFFRIAGNVYILFQFHCRMPAACG